MSLLEDSDLPSKIDRMFDDVYSNRVNVGFHDVRNLLGGMKAWKSFELPVK